MRAFAKCVLGFTLAMTAAAVSAQDYPTRPIKMVIPYGPGGGTDLVARKVAEHMRATLGQPVVVENVAGAGGNIGAAQVARAPGDGYTIMVTAAGLAIAPAVGTKLSFDVARDLTPIAQLATVPLLVLVRPDSPMNSIADLLAQAKKQAGKFSFASFGVGTPPHLVGESMKLLGKIEMTHVPYKGSAAAMPDTLSGRVDIAILDQALRDQQVVWLIALRARRSGKESAHEEEDGEGEQKNLERLEPRKARNEIAGGPAEKDEEHQGHGVAREEQQTRADAGDRGDERKESQAHPEKRLHGDPSAEPPDRDGGKKGGRDHDGRGRSGDTVPPRLALGREVGVESPGEQGKGGRG